MASSIHQQLPTSPGGSGRRPTGGAPADAPRHPSWLAPAWDLPRVGAVMTTRLGGASAAPFDSFNLRDGLGDADDAVARNRARFERAMIGATPVYLDQVHGTVVAHLGREDIRPGAAVRRADASVTALPGIACTVQVADCLPVLFAAHEARAVGAAHAGWRGLAAGVLEATLQAVCDAARCAPPQVHAWLGPCIGPAHFEVGEDVLRAFGVGAGPAAGAGAGMEAGVEPTAGRALGLPAHRAAGRAASTRFAPRFDRAASPARPTWLADLAGLAHDRLLAAGVTSVSGSAWCTVSDASRFFSFRRDGVTGRMAAAVWIEPGRGGAGGISRFG